MSSCRVRGESEKARTPLMIPDHTSMVHCCFWSEYQPNILINNRMHSFNRIVPVLKGVIRENDIRVPQYGVELKMENNVYRSAFRIINTGAFMSPHGRSQSAGQHRNGDANPDSFHESHSWMIISDQVAVKRMDRSSFIHHEMAIPVGIRPFFNLETMTVGEKRQVILTHGVIEYPAYFEMLIEKNPRTRLVWKSDLQHLIHEQFPAWATYFRNNSGPVDATPNLKIKKTRSPSKYLLFFEDIKRSSGSLELLKVYSREELRDRFHTTDTIIKNGIHTPQDTSSVWLFVTEERSPDGISFRNHFDGKVLQLERHFKGRIGGLITNHESEGNEIVVLYRRKRRDPGFRYVGRFSYLTHTSGQFIGDPARFTLFPLDVMPDGEGDLIPAGSPAGSGERSIRTCTELHPQIRLRTIRSHGTICAVCGFSFAEQYGAYGEGFIEIHCRDPVVKGRKDQVDECVPVCPNCHRMIHRAGPMLTIEELKKIIR